MKKKFAAILALLLTFCMLTPAFAFDLSIDGINAVVDRIYAIDAEKRETLYVVGSPLIITDNGVDSLINMVTSYENGTSSGMFDSYIEMALNYTDSDTLIRSLKSIKCVSPEIRQKYVDIFDRSVEYDLSSSDAAAFNAFMSKTYSVIPNLKPLLEQFEITDATIANLLGVFGEINEEPIFKMDNGKYTVNKVSSSLQNSLDEVWSGTQTSVKLSDSFASFAQLLNSATSADERTKLNPLFREIGLLKEADSESTGGGSSSGSSSGTSGGNSSGEIFIPAGTAEIKELESLEGVTTEGKIYSVNVTGGLGRVAFDAADESLILKKVTDDSLIPVKLSVNKDGKITAVLEGNANYVVENAGESPFDDVSGWAKTYVDSLYVRKIINGKTETAFMPTENITREEFVKLVVEMFDIAAETESANFADVEQGSWYAKYVAAAFENGIINGVSETEFGVGQNIKRQDMAKIINTILTKNSIFGKISENAFNDFDTVADYAKEPVSQIKSFGIISGDENGNFNPNSFATRQEAAKMIYGLLETYVFNKGVAVIK